VASLRASGELRVEALSASYGGPDVIHDIDLRAAPRAVTAVVGPNGAGKTTLLNAISGLAAVTGGRMTLGGRPIHTLAPHQVVAAGIAHVPQGRALFGYSTGYENLKLGAFVRRDRAAVEDDIAAFAERWPVASRVLRTPAHLMSGGEQQVIAIGRAIMSRPSVLLLDEPSLGLAPVLVDRLFAMIRDLRDGELGDIALLLVEQNVAKTLEVADHVHVLANGRVVLDGPARALTSEQIAGSFIHASA
jgi:branched-chain amino acid transport system ATP-binding protein